MELKDKKTKITFHSGILTIGGTIVEIKYGKDRIFFDFGTEYRPELQLKDDSLETLIENRLIPVIDIYDETLRPNTNYENTSVFISHCHLDHTRMLNYLDERIPVYVLNETKVLLETINADNNFLIPAVNKPYLTHPMIGVENESVIEQGEIKVKLMRVDHDAYGACGMIITTPDMKIVYTGDIRLHGFDEDASLKFCEEAKGCDVLIMEGVSISFENDPSRKQTSTRFSHEQDLLNQVVEVIDANPDQQITFNGYEGNVKRFAEIVKQVKRRVVLEAKMASVLKKCLNMDVPYYQLDNTKWDLNPSLKVDYEELLKDNSKYLWQVLDFDEALDKNGIYFHLDATPLGLFDPNYQPFVDTFTNHGITFNHYGCSGHAHPEDLDKIISLIQPKVLVPIHTLKPELLNNPYGERHLPTRGETI